MTGPRQRVALIAALPVVCCMILPLYQVAGFAYLYDIVLGFSVLSLGFPKARVQGGSQYRLIWKILFVAVLVGWLVAMLRTGLIVRPAQYTAQYLLALLYARAVYQNILVGWLDLQRFASVITFSGLLLAGIGIVQFILFQINTTLAVDLYSRYLEFSGFTTDFFQGRYLSGVRDTGMVRVMGSWDTSTAYAGMLALSAAWLLISKQPAKTSLIILVVIALTIFATGSRHGWLVVCLLFFAIADGSAIRRLLTITLVTSLLAAAVVLVDTGRSSSSNVLSLSDQLDARLARTIEQGGRDSSLQSRYVEGTARFLSYALQDPTVLVLGVGTGTDKGLFEVLGKVNFDALMMETHQLGFVSNSWLLFWRNWGILGFIGMIALFAHIYRLRGNASRHGLIAAGLIILADNYSAHVARCFFLLFLFLSALAAQGLVERNERLRYG